MSSDISLLMPLHGPRLGELRQIGYVSIRKVGWSGQAVDSEKCLDIEVDTHPADNVVITALGQAQDPAVFTWLTLEAEIWTIQAPRRRVGRVHIPETAMLPIGVSRQGPARWPWVIQPEDVELVERVRAANPAGPMYFSVKIKGIARLSTPSGEVFTIEALRGSTSQLTIEPSQWKRFLDDLGYALPPSHMSLAGQAALDHPTWAVAIKALDLARQHHRVGEDYEALRACLSAFEALVPAPYSAASWQQRLGELSSQKANGVAELLSGLATYCNRIGHHRSRAERDPAGNLTQMPLDHWEADLVIGAAQFLLAYASRLRLGGVLGQADSTAGAGQSASPAHERAAAGPS